MQKRTVHPFRYEYFVTFMTLNIFITLIVLISLEPVKGQEKRTKLNNVLLHKCCPFDQILDEWADCVELPRRLRIGPNFGAYKSAFVENICRDMPEHLHPLSICSNAMDPDQIQLTESEELFSCPKRARTEMTLMDIYPANNSFLVHRSRDSSEAVQTVVQNGLGCVDLALLPDGGGIEGPFLQVCHSHVKHVEPPGFIRKCCQMNEILNGETCVRLADVIPQGEIQHYFRNWLPDRLVRHPATGAALFKHFINVTGLSVQGGCDPIMSRALFLLSDGKAVIPSDERESSHSLIDYHCADRTVLLNNLSGQPPSLSPIVVLSCDQKSGTIPSEEEICKNVTGSSSATCLPKCCGSNEVFNLNVKRCQELGNKGHQWDNYRGLSRDNTKHAFSPQVFNRIFPHKPVSSDEESLGMTIIPHVLPRMEHRCGKEEDGKLIFIQPKENVKILTDGSLYYQGLGAWRTDFCVDTFVNTSVKSAFILAFKCERSLEDYIITEGNLVACYGDTMQRFMTSFRLAYVVCGCFSIFFLSVTLFVYVTLPGLNNLHGKIVISNVVSILSTTIALLVLFNVQAKKYTGVASQNHTDTTKQEQDSSEFIIGLAPVPCKVVGYITYYLGVTMFFWMSVMCFDLGWTFFRARIPRKGSDCFKFSLYSLVAWGFPLILMLMVGLVDMGVIPPVRSVRPRIGEDTCFLSIEALQLYFYSPMLVLLCFNTVMFVITIYSLWKSKRMSRLAGVQKQTPSRQQSSQDAVSQNHLSISRKSCSDRLSVLSKQGSGSSSMAQGSTSYTRVNSDTREEAVLFLKLFIIMGMSWFSEVIHIQLHGDHSDLISCSFYLEIFLRILGGINMTRGFFIFLVFIWKKSIWKAVQQTHPRLARILARCFCCCQRLSRQNSENADYQSKTTEMQGCRFKENQQELISLHSMPSACPRSPRNTRISIEIESKNRV